jgi:hypothetical protein
MEKHKAVVELADGTFIEITEETSGKYDDRVDKINILYNDNHGPSSFFSYEPKGRKLSDVQICG